MFTALYRYNIFAICFALMFYDERISQGLNLSKGNFLSYRLKLDAFIYRTIWDNKSVTSVSHFPYTINDY